MFCKNCGKEIADQAAYCVHCGAVTDNPSAFNTQPVVTGNRTNGFAIAGFVLSFFSYLAILGLIFSCVGLNYSKQPEYSGNGKRLSIAGIVISCVSIVFWVIFAALP
ncbi:MAG: zinc ribbon domain-containing protein [Clostridia bacterium]|nr:zinc ribbon domain-containing protein [Clostridia bacterium]